MSELVSINSLIPSFPTDSENSDVVCVQLKSYRQKDAYFTVAVFRDFVQAKEFVEMFPNIPGSKLRIKDCFENTLYQTCHSYHFSVNKTGTLNWWFDQCDELKDCVSGVNFFIAVKKPEIPGFSLKSIARKIKGLIK
jgi:hypothetical protein